jgi:hypothetical protein
MITGKNTSYLCALNKNNLYEKTIWANLCKLQNNPLEDSKFSTTFSREMGVCLVFAYWSYI